MSPSVRDLIQEAARLICYGGFADYGAARRKAIAELGASGRVVSINHVDIEEAVLDLHESSGGAEHQEALKQLRIVALEAMRFLSDFEPRLAGSTVSGAIGLGHRVQIHLHEDFAESVEMKFHSLKIPFRQSERSYSIGRHPAVSIPLIQFEVDTVGIDVATFPHACLRQAPLSQVTGRPAKRLSSDQLAKLLKDSKHAP